MHISVEDSLKKLRTNYIDILYVHWVGASHLLPDRWQANIPPYSGTGIAVSRRS